MSALIPAATAAGPLVTGWGLHTLWLRRKLEHARRDPLTGLLTRETFDKRASAMMRDVPCAVLVIDLDGFKALNDSYGHAAGDAALAVMAYRIDAYTPGTAARLGGDEFALITTMPRPASLPRLLAGLHTWLCEPVDFEDRSLPLGASIGAVWTGELRDAELPLAKRRADEAMYAAKRSGGGWLIAHGSESTHETVNGRRAGRGGTHNPAPSLEGRSTPWL